MRVVRIDYHQPGGRLPFERGPEMPRNWVEIAEEIAYMRKYEGATHAEYLPVKFPVLARVKLTIPNQPPLVLVMRDCGAY